MDDRTFVHPPRRRCGPSLLDVTTAIALACLPLSAAAPVRAQTATDLGLGGYTSCAVLTTGSVQCWGDNRTGQLGDGSTSPYSTLPRMVSGITNAVDVEVGNAHACALLSTGAVACWGANTDGQVGLAAPQIVWSPVTVPLPGAATAVGAGKSHSCALLADGRVFCWGKTSLLGQLGDGNRFLTSSWVQIVEVQGVTGAVALTVGIDHACAVLTGGSVVCWGSNLIFELGVPNAGLADCGSGTFCSPSPVTVPGITATTVAAGGHHTCAVLTDQTVTCWGSWPGLGNGTQTDSSSPTPVLGPVLAAMLGAGFVHHCALTPGAEVQCWGANSHGQIGDQSFVCNSCQSTTPVPVPSLSGSVFSIAGGAQHTCAIRTDGSVSCLGSNQYGQLGNGSTVSSAIPVTVSDPATTQGLTIVPPSATLPVGTSLTFQTVGGTPPYTFSLVVNTSGATIGGATGVYVAGTAAGFTDVVRVTDQAGNFSQATVNVTAAPVDADADGLDDGFESSFGGAGITIFSPSASPPHTASATGDASSGATISVGDLTIDVPPGTTAESPTTEINIRYRDNSPGPGRDPSAEISGLSLPPGETKSVEMPFGDRDAVCIDDAPTATLETVDAMAGDCLAPAVQMAIPDQIGNMNASGPYAVIRISSERIRIDGLAHTAVIAITQPYFFLRLAWWLRILVVILVLGIGIVSVRWWMRRKRGPIDV